MKLIDADKAIEIWKEKNFIKFVGQEKKAKMLLDVLPTEPRWIPVSERLPEENGQYLITVKYKPEAGYENIYTEYGEWTDGRWDMFCFGHCGEVEDIIAWMPLPESYRGDKDGNINNKE